MLLIKEMNHRKGHDKMILCLAVSRESIFNTPRQAFLD